MKSVTSITATQDQAYDTLLRNNMRPGVKVERIYRVLLEISNSERTVYRIAKDAGADYHWTVNTLAELERAGIVRGASVRRPKDLFRIWARRPTSTVFREYNVQDPVALLQGITLPFSLTTYYAEQLTGNYLFPRSYDVYIHTEDAMKWHGALMEHGLAGKGNFRIFAGDEHIFWKNRTVNGVPVVSIQQLIVDLLREGDLATEAAELLVRRFYDAK